MGLSRLTVSDLGLGEENFYIAAAQVFPAPRGRLNGLAGPSGADEQMDAVAYS